jgi:hypothetical protein
VKKFKAWLNNNPILGASATLAAIVFISGTVWSFGNAYGFRPALLKELQMVMEQTQQNTDSINIRELIDLEEKRKLSTLTFEESVKRCQLAKALDWDVDGCK